MAQPLLASCGLSEPALPPGLTLVRQHSAVDGSFLIAAVLGHRLKLSRNERVLLIAAHHSYSHYSSACLKLAYNLGPARDSGQLEIFDVGAEVAQNYPVLPALNDIQKRIETFLEQSPEATVLIDDLTFLLNFGHSETELINLVETWVSLANAQQSFVIKLNTAELYDWLCDNLVDMAEIEVRLEQLTSGNFREVDGRLNVSRLNHADSRGENSLISFRTLEKSLLYKVNDRSIKVFVPGEVGIKNV
ncbi:elongator complex protein 6 [Sabethes cyaneus]|uniref:elongator complex protein 6 n=1 Tax=Sabethes cyaneus TaxID=53552 RepID=UPI00237E9F61|nr:elongator complex protein 6 [Sabethes cyaneus]XP_053698587.1 elongator complex protein 6 [Sabethes cyaneus]